MADRSVFFPRPLYLRDMRWDPFSDEHRPGRLHKPDAGLPPFLEPGDLSWIEWARRRLATSSWPGYMPPPLYTPSPMQAPIPPYPSSRMGQAGGVSEVRTGPESWRINLDVSCFSPREVTIKTRGGYLEISGNHEDRQDDYGFVSKYFSRKYNRLPAGADLRHIRSALSADGVLSVEAPLPAHEIPVEIIIPVQVEKRPQKKSNGLYVAAAPPTGGQEKSNGLQEVSGDAVERVWTGAGGVEPEEVQSMEREVREEGDSKEVSALTEVETAAPAEPDSVGQEGEDVSHSAPGDSVDTADPASEAQSSGHDGLKVEEERKHLETKWLHRDTKWMLRSTKWPSQQQ
ncbi:hypothetical protein AAFF_G00197420 [Aldrovandia affinis]|uniref:SHSP domain-containing protein n=1 Tax=Aldrovandia affinis TaxID=143900 RepID=A0AAD7RIM8_9TELE|nr:hypothetical protein AAFF_G00197420 [Aldrovandia affinis]